MAVRSTGDGGRVLRVTNPAQQLHKLLVSWQPSSGNHVFSARRGSDDNLDFWRTQGRAVGLLLEIEALLGGLKAADEDVSLFERYLPHWYVALFLPRANWAKTDDAGKAIPEHVLHQLWSLGQVLNAHKLSDTLAAETVQDLLDALEEAERLVREIDDMPVRERIYILGLIGEARRAASDVETFGGAGARRLTIEIGGAMMLIAGRSNDVSFIRRCSDAARRLLSLVWWKVADRAIDTGVDEVFKQIGSS